VDQQIQDFLDGNHFSILVVEPVGQPPQLHSPAVVEELDVAAAVVLVAAILAETVETDLS
jgi:hypothetical protein